MNKEIRVEIAKAHEELGMLFGFAIICNEGDEPYYDLQGDHIPEEAMLRAAVDFMVDWRYAYDSHVYGIGTVIFAWPLTKDIAEAVGLETKKTGLLIGLKVDNTDVITRFREGIYTGFSIGGVINQADIVED